MHANPHLVLVRAAIRLLCLVIAAGAAHLARLESGEQLQDLLGLLQGAVLTGGEGWHGRAGRLWVHT